MNGIAKFRLLGVTNKLVI